ncbi:adenylyl-sulfate kinase [Aureibacter tunicatorum]|uniref:Adenylyl-sulfate kinase n=1 Tax=Aureibacter tunicatorum TaxID=866807 RepID=A0AAE3XQM5_9BACT|nr:adenylyl-sulfate kinase [Aureibacter tunicatorum]MDR6240165.1 adenylylsulfate kinase [Aureibacter tunicatorum]BDD05954.1 adenylyl-sulfate kinase [Aureibacter tunicatorum]
MSAHIYPIFDTLLQKEDKEKVLKQKACVIWMVGLSGSGKSTLARALENTLHEKGYLTQLLDGDNLRTGINNNLGFSEEDRIENIRRAAETSKLFANCGIVTICSLISPTEQIRSMAKEIIGEEDYFEVFISCPIEVCEQRDVKGLYAKARKGEIKHFTGIDSPFEEPQNPSLIIETDKDELSVSHQKLVDAVLEKIKYTS